MSLPIRQEPDSAKDVPPSPPSRPPLWALSLAFVVVYLAYGLNYVAIKVGVQELPPFLFAGTHVTCAGLVLFGWVFLRGAPVAIGWGNYFLAAAAGIIVFIGGTGMVTLSESLGVHADLAAILRSTTPVLIAGLECLRPQGERLSAASWLGLLVGMAGIVMLVGPRFVDAHDLDQVAGPLLVLVSALSWAVGAILLRHHRPCPSNALATAYEMTAGGVLMIVLGLALGEAPQLAAAHITGRVVFAFLFLLLVHSLAGFTALNWLLKHVPAPLAGTKFLVSPAVALVSAYLVLGEPIQLIMVVGLALILLGVGLALSRPGLMPRGKT